MSVNVAGEQLRSRYNREAILSASPARLLTMLYDRLLLDLHRAEAAQLAEDWPTASENLLHAQAIVAELTSSLRLDVWDGAQGLLGLYNYVSSSLVYANMHRDATATRTCAELLEPLRLSWHEAADRLAESTASARPTGTIIIA